MPSLLQDFYSEDLNQYYYVDDAEYYDDDDDEIEFYYDEDSDEQTFYYVDDNMYYEDDEQTFYYVDDDEPMYYYVDDEPEYYYVEEPAPEPQMYFKKEVNIAPKVVNTPRDPQGNSWEAASFEIDKEINNIAQEEGVDYATAYRMFGQRYEEYQPDLSEYI